MKLSGRDGATRTALQIRAVIGAFAALLVGALVLMSAGPAAAQNSPGGTNFLVRASGTTGSERMEIRAGGNVVSRIDVTNEIADYEVEVPAGTSIDEIQVAFVNDEIVGKRDRNLTVVHVELDGRRFQTSAEATTSTGTFNLGTGCAPSSSTLSETLHCNGFFQYSPNSDTESANPSVLTVRAISATGDELIEIRVDGEVVTQRRLLFDRFFADYNVDLPRGTTIDEIQVAFVNDAIVGGRDRNVVIDYVELDGVRYQTEAGSTTSTGTFIPGSGCGLTSNTASTTLHCNGYFQYGDSAVPGPASATVFRLRAMGSTGDEVIDIRVNGSVVASRQLSSGNFGALSVDVPAGTSIDEIQVAFVNDAIVGGRDRNVVVDYVELAGVRYQTEAAQTTSTGTFISGSGCAPTSNTSSVTLHCNGYFQYGG